MSQLYDPHGCFKYPLTVISAEHKSYTSQTIAHPYCFQVYCPLSCKRIRIGVKKDKHQDTREFNTTSSRCVSVALDTHLIQLLDGFPPVRPLSNAIQSPSAAHLQVHGLNNFAIINPFLPIPLKPSSISLSPQHISFTPPPPLPLHQILHFKNNTAYFHCNENGSFISHNPFFNDSINGTVTLENEQKGTSSMPIKEWKTLIDSNLNYYLTQLQYLSQAQSNGKANTALVLNLDQIYENVNYFLNLDEQLRAKTLTTQGKQANKLFQYHPRLYSAFNRLSSFVNYGCTHYKDIITLAQNGFFCKTDMLQDLAFYQHPEVPIPTAQSLQYSTVEELKHKCFPMSRNVRQLPHLNVPLQRVIRGLPPQKVCEGKVIRKHVEGDYMVVVDSNLNIGLWGCKVMASKLFETNIRQMFEEEKSNKIQFYKVLEIKDLFDMPIDEPSPAVEQPEQMVPKEQFLQALIVMGYKATTSKKALIECKNKSLEAAIDVIELIKLEEEKKIKSLPIVKQEWKCNQCTFINGVNQETCQICGGPNDEYQTMMLKEMELIKYEKEREIQQIKEMERQKVEKENKQKSILQEKIKYQLEMKIKKQEKLLESLKILEIRIIKHQNNAIDPFFILVLLENNGHSQLQIFRIGLNREYLLRFMAVETDSLVSNFNRKIHPKTFEGVNEIVKQAFDLVEWRIRLLEAPIGNEWILINQHSMQFQTLYHTIQIANNTFKLKSAQSESTYIIVPIDNLQKQSFKVDPIDYFHKVVDMNVREQLRREKQFINVNVGQIFPLNESVNSLQIEVLQHIPAGQWKEPSHNTIQRECHKKEEVIMSQFLPLLVEHYEGSVFSWKYYSSNLFDKNNFFISNYPQTCFTFKSLTEQSMFIEKVVVISPPKKSLKIYPVEQGLIFTANELAYFHIARKNFKAFSYDQYIKWAVNKQKRQYWEPVGAFKVEGEVEIQLDFKRAAKYICLIPFVRPQTVKKKDQVYGIKFNFFGVKGSLESATGEQPQINNFKNDSQSDCQLRIMDEQGKEFQQQWITISRKVHVNSLHFLPQSFQAFSTIPFTQTVVYDVKLCGGKGKKNLTIYSKYSKCCRVYAHDKATSNTINLNQISSYNQLTAIQNNLTLTQLISCTDKLPLNELLLSMLNCQNQHSSYDLLFKRMQDIPSFKPQFTRAICQILPVLCDESIPVNDSGFARFLMLLQKYLNNQSFPAYTEAIRNINKYVKRVRNPNYNILRHIHEIQDLVLEPHLFRKHYFRLVHPTHVEQILKPTPSLDSDVVLNNHMYIRVVSPFHYDALVDLQQVKKVSALRIFFPKLANLSNRPKLTLTVVAHTPTGTKQLYYRYFHQDFLVQMGVNAFKDPEMYKGTHLNSLIIPNIAIQTQYLQITMHFLLVTLYPRNLNEPGQSMTVLCQVQSTQSVYPSEQPPTIPSILQEYPKELALEQGVILNQDYMPPAKYVNHSKYPRYQVYDFPAIQRKSVQTEFKEQIDLLTANIMDKEIVSKCVAAMKINLYELEKKGLDFAYNYHIALLPFITKYNTTSTFPVALLLDLFDTFIVYELGPIMKRTLLFLQELYNRLCLEDKIVFIHSIVDQYLANGVKVLEMRQCDKYSPKKIIDKLEQFQLPFEQLLKSLSKANDKMLKVCFMKMLKYAIETRGEKCLEDDPNTIEQAMKYCFDNALWNVRKASAVKEQTLSQAISLLMALLGSKYKSKSVAMRHFVKELSQEDFWSFVFLTLRVRSQGLNRQMDSVLAMLIPYFQKTAQECISRMLQEIITLEPNCLYLRINGDDELWLAHLQLIMQLLQIMKKTFKLKESIALKLISLPLNSALWSLALKIIPDSDTIVDAICDVFPLCYYSSLRLQLTVFWEKKLKIQGLSSLRINWFEVLRKVRKEKITLAQFVTKQLQCTTFGGINGLTMASQTDVKNLSIAYEYVILLQKSTFTAEMFTPQVLRILFLWFLVNESEGEKHSPATKMLFDLVTAIRGLFRKMAEVQQICLQCLPVILQVKQQSDCIYEMCDKKLLPVHFALELLSGFSARFTELYDIFAVNEHLTLTFAQLSINYLMKAIDLQPPKQITQLQPTTEDNLLIGEGLLKNQPSLLPVSAKEIPQLKEEQFGITLKVVETLKHVQDIKMGQNTNQVSSLFAAATVVDWTVNKKGNKSKIHTLQFTEDECVFYVQLAKSAQIRSIKIGFVTSAFDVAERVCAAPSGLLVQGSANTNNFQPLGEMTPYANQGEMTAVEDFGYASNGTYIYVLNCQKISTLGTVQEIANQHRVKRVKFLKITVKKPLITFLQGTYSSLNGKPYNKLSSYINFLSITGDDAEKLPFSISHFCREILKKSSLELLSTMLSNHCSPACTYIANNEFIAESIKSNFKGVKNYLNKYIAMSRVIFFLSTTNVELGDWIFKQLLNDEDTSKVQSQLECQIILDTPSKAVERLSLFHHYLLNKLEKISLETSVESGLLYERQMHLMDSFCKTIQSCYTMNLLRTAPLTTTIHSIKAILKIYADRHNAPYISNLIRLLINIVYVQPPLIFSPSLLSQTLHLIWQQCTEEHSFFYTLLAVMVVPSHAKPWITIEKIDTLFTKIQSNIVVLNARTLKRQLALLTQMAIHYGEYMLEKDMPFILYHSLKAITLTDSSIYDTLIQLMSYTILPSASAIDKLATAMVGDLELLIKRKDPLLQKLFIGLLGMEEEVHVNVQDAHYQGEFIKEKKKQLNTKFMDWKQKKQIMDINKQVRQYQLITSCDRRDMTVEAVEAVAKALRSPPILLACKFTFKHHSYVFGALIPNKCKPQITSNKQDSKSTNKPTLEEISKANKQEDTSAQINENIILFLISQNAQRVALLQNKENKFTMDVSERLLEKFQIYNKTSNILSINKRIIHLDLSAFTQHSTIFPQLNGSFDQENLDYKFIGFQCWQLFLKTSLPSDPTTNTYLNKMKKRFPYYFYRQSPIYTFSSNITVQKLFSILQITGVFSLNNKEVNVCTPLHELQSDAPDKILQLKSLRSSASATNKEQGYIPVTKVFNSFSEKGGTHQVICLGSVSVKSWTDPDRKKNFEHYLSELKSFINLPRFFSLFVKEPQYITFLFEVATGLPDIANSKRDWEEEYLASFKAIYKIIADIFKFDRSLELRSMDNYGTFLEVILEKLAEVSKETIRVRKDEEEDEGDAPTMPSVKRMKSEEKKFKKKKGTGYGVENQNNSKWAISQWMEKKKNKSQEILRVTTIISCFLDCQTLLQDQEIAQVIKQSCLLPLIENALRSTSLLNISKESELFNSCLTITRNLAKHPATISCLIEIDKAYKPQQTQSIQDLLNKLKQIAVVFTSCVESESLKIEANDAVNFIAKDIIKASTEVEKAVRKIRKTTKSVTIKDIDSLPVAAAYRALLSHLRFGYVDLKKNGAYKHCLASSISGTGQPAKILRLSQELADLSSSLPCEHTNSIFVRCDKSRIDVITVLIMGSKDTPYSNGAFVFDVYCDNNYPNNPPKMLISTTGEGKIRFNPNLYSCGKVCLSLLGTWRGSASQNWDGKVSTLLQLFISTQAITMCEDIYFNEPGFEGEQGTEEGEKKNEAYSNVVRYGNVRFAMINQIKNPPLGFEEVVKRHFYVKRQQILQECQKWIQYAEKRPTSYTGLVQDHNNQWCNEFKAGKDKYKDKLVEAVEELKKLLYQLPQPNLEEIQEVEETNEEKKQEIQECKELNLNQVDVGYEQSETNETKHYEESVMQDRWSRYIGAMGIEAVKKQADSTVLLIGFRSLGLEIAKNLVLSGLKKLTIVDYCPMEDYSEHFFMSNVKSKNIKDCIFKIRELNPYMIIRFSEQIPDVSTFSLVVSTSDLYTSTEIGSKCRSAGVKFIYAEQKGSCGNYFADFGPEFVINDTNGEESFQAVIKGISSEGVVTLLNGVKHPYQDGDYVVLHKIEGMKQISPIQSTEEQVFFQTLTKQKPQDANGRVFKIKVINWNSFSIGDISMFQLYIGGGLVKNVKMPCKIHFQPMQQCSKEYLKYVDTNLGIYDFQKINDNFKVFLSFEALARFYFANKRCPQNYNVEDYKIFQKQFMGLLTERNIGQDEKQSYIKFARLFCFTCQAELPAIGAYFGGIVAQEVIKAITNKYTPIKQFFAFHFNQIIQPLPQDQTQVSVHAIKQGPFRSLRILVGEAGAEKVRQVRTFVIGAGAIGCQLLKNFAMANIGAKGELVVTDPDHIQTSNLSRQFLFRQKHVKKSKSATACATLLQMNPFLQGRISARLDKIFQDTQSIYSDAFFKSRTIVANALDNVRARQYVDKRCVMNKIPLLESGTLGPKGHLQVIVPYKTENYGSQNDPNEQTQIPHCTLKMFPEETVHCIEWARDIFSKLFTLNPKSLKKLLESKDINSVEGQQRRTVGKMLLYRPQSVEDCVREACRKFFVYFRNNVRQLMYTYPLDMKTKEGRPFWQLPKRPPQQIKTIDPKNQVHRTFISSYAAILAKVYAVPFDSNFRTKESKDKLMEIALKVDIQQYVPNAQESKQLEKEVQSQGQAPLQLLHTTSFDQKEFTLKKEDESVKIIPQQFEKDQDANGHIDLIYSMSNLRAFNYSLEQCTWIDAKLKAGKIMAALSTTTSVVAALQTIEAIKLAIGCTVWRSAYINIAVPLIQISEPGPPTKHPIGNTTFDVWGQWEFKADTLGTLLRLIQTQYQVQTANVSTIDGKPIYWPALYIDKIQAKESLLKKPLLSMFGEKEVYFNISMNDIKTGEPYEHVPKVKVYVI